MGGANNRLKGFYEMGFAPSTTTPRFSAIVGARYVSKARKRDVGPDTHPVVEAAQRNERRIEAAYQFMVEQVREAVPLYRTAEFLEHGNVTGLLQELDIEARMRVAAEGAGLGARETSFVEALQQTFLAGAHAELELLERVRVQKAAGTIGAAMSLNLINAETVAFLTTYTFNLIRQISSDSRFAIQDIVLEAFRHGGHPYEQARDIRRMIGLTRSQARAVANFRRMLEGDPQAMGEALTRQLRDRRFDPTILRSIRTGTRLKREQVDKMVDAYYWRYLNYRAKMIARTESLRASNMGQRALWQQAMDQDFLQPERTRRQWILTGDDRLCEFCLSIRNMNPKGVRLDEPFLSPDGPVDGPPVHPHCRCTTGLRFISKDEEE